MTEDPGELTGTSPVGIGAGVTVPVRGLDIVVGESELDIAARGREPEIVDLSGVLDIAVWVDIGIVVEGVVVCVCGKTAGCWVWELKKSLALRPGAAVLGGWIVTFLCLGRDKLLQPKETHRQTTNKRSEIF